jgi:hypothetical protein
MQADGRGKPITGDDSAIASVLESAIAHSILVAVITSAQTLASVWVRREIDLARRLQKPLFFWHVIQTDEAETISVRRGGAPPSPHLVGESFLRDVEPHYRREFLASSAASMFMQELSAQGELNVIGHKIVPLLEVGRVFDELSTVIELAELVLHRRQALNADSLQRFWTEYERLCERAEKLADIIHERFGRDIHVGRRLVAHGFRLKRPFVLGRVRHLERLLEDDRFRETEFRRIDTQ